MLEVLWKVYRRCSSTCYGREKYFRILRMPMPERRALIVTEEDVNWIRICRRLDSLYELAPIYNRRRTAWCFFNRWLKLRRRRAWTTLPAFKCTCAVLEIFPPSMSTSRLTASSRQSTLTSASTQCAASYRCVQEVDDDGGEDQVLRVMESKAHRAYEIVDETVFEPTRTMMTPEETFRSAPKPSHAA